MFRLTRLTLTRFRNFTTLDWQPGSRISVITGPNGSGKTNLLEALSLLAPGRGLRRARISELGQAGEPWGVVGRVLRSDGQAEIATGTPPDGMIERRVFRLDGEPVRNQTDIAGVIAAVWLTPQMDRLFGDAPAGRRRFLDRLVWALEPGHARELAAYETALASRARLLVAGSAEPAWLDGLEHSLARHGVAVSAARASFVARINEQMGMRLEEGLPRAMMSLHDPIADRLTKYPAIAVEDRLRAQLLELRDQATAAPTRWGSHQADFTLAERETGIDASLASTGQQKSLLIAVVLGHAKLVGEARGDAPLLLLDEPAVHLDQNRRTALWEALAKSPSQVVVTGTDEVPFARLQGSAEFLFCHGGELRTNRAELGV